MVELGGLEPPYLFNAIEALSQMSYSPTYTGGLPGHHTVDYTKAFFRPRKEQRRGEYLLRSQ